jgi:hypothetical protein
MTRSKRNVRQFFELILIQLVALMIGLLAMIGISDSLEAVPFFMAASWLIMGGTLVLTTCPDLGVSLALVGPLFGLTIFLPFLAPAYDHRPLVAIWVVWLILSAILIQTRARWRSLLWKGSTGDSRKIGRLLVIFEVVGSASFLIAGVALESDIAEIINPQSLVLGVTVSVVTWMLLPRTRESLYYAGPDESEITKKVPFDGGSESSRRRSALISATLSTAVFFIAGLSLPMIYAIWPTLGDGYLLAGILFVDVGTLRAIAIDMATVSAPADHEPSLSNNLNRSNEDGG